jgi:hypothetical protein
MRPHLLTKPEARSLRTKAVWARPGQREKRRLARLAWCWPEHLAEYTELAKKVGPTVAKAAILAKQKGREPQTGTVVDAGMQTGLHPGTL